MIAGELRAKLLRQLRGQAGLRGDAPNHTPAHQAPLAWRVPEGPEGLAAVPAGGGAWPDNEATRRTTRQHTRPHWRGGRRRDGGPGCGARGRLRGPARQRANAPNHTSAHQAPPVWRAPEGPEGTGGLRDRPLRAAGSRVAISRAAGPSGAQNTSGATRHLGTTKPPSPTGAGRLRQSAREGQRRITTMSGSPRPLS